MNARESLTPVGDLAGEGHPDNMNRQNNLVSAL